VSARANIEYLKAIGSRILGEANDLKRTPEALAADLGRSLDDVQAIIEGRADIEAARALLFAMADRYPISISDIWVDADDTDRGVRIMRADDSARSARVFQRRDRSGGDSDYYDYRDTAMSRTAPFKPEWIRELRVVGDADPNNPDVAYNNGHFLHQTTFFIGPVNFYWELGGKKHCVELDTGDSNYITPFVPHSFTSRDPNNLGLIIAVTYTGQVGPALRDFMMIGAEAATHAAGDLRTADIFYTRLRRHMDAESLDSEALVERLEEAGLCFKRSRAMLAPDAAPTFEEIKVLAACLSIRPADLMVTGMDQKEAVIVRRRGEVTNRPFPSSNRPAYRIAELARSRQQPYLKGFDITVLDQTGATMQHGLHQYVFNYGDTPVRIGWNASDTATLAPGDSAYVQPLVAHRFACALSGTEGRLAVIRVPGRLNDGVLDEFATFAPEGRDRVAGESRRWF
jgi:methylphosphonate synthase